MKKIINLYINEFSPVIRKAGIEKKFQFEANKFRKIYDYEMLFCSKGIFNIQLKNEELILNRGDIAIIKPEQSHIFSIPENTIVYWVHFDPIYYVDKDLLTNFINSNGSKLILFREDLPKSHLIRPIVKINGVIEFPNSLSVFNIEATEDLFKKLVMKYETKAHLWKFQSKIILLQIFEEIFTSMGLKKAITTDTTIAVAVIENYIKENYYRKITMRELSNFTKYSEDYLGKIFKKKAGVSINEYINKCRIEKAKELLRRTNFSIENIAEATGFSDRYYFSKVMKKMTGYSPKYYRQSQ